MAYLNQYGLGLFYKYCHITFTAAGNGFPNGSQIIFKSSQLCVVSHFWILFILYAWEAWGELKFFSTAFSKTCVRSVLANIMKENKSHFCIVAYTVSMFSFHLYIYHHESRNSCTNLIAWNTGFMFPLPDIKKSSWHKCEHVLVYEWMSICLNEHQSWKWCFPFDIIFSFCRETKSFKTWKIQFATSTISNNSCWMHFKTLKENSRLER